MNGSGSIIAAALLISSASLLACAAGPLTYPTRGAPQTFEHETDQGTWVITHARQSASARHLDTGVVRSLYAADDPGDYEDEHEYYGFKARLVSVVGTHVTFEVSEGGYSEGAAHGFAVHHFSTIDLSLSSRIKDGHRKRAGIPLDWLMHEGLDCGQEMRSKAVVPEVRAFCEGRDPELLIETALALDPWLTSVRKDPMSCAHNPGMLMGNSYGFQDIESGVVTMLLGIGHGCEVARGSFHQIQLRLPIPLRLAQDLRLARERGLLARDLRPLNDWQEGQ